MQESNGKKHKIQMLVSVVIFYTKKSKPYSIKQRHRPSRLYSQRTAIAAYNSPCYLPYKHNIGLYHCFGYIVCTFAIITTLRYSKKANISYNLLRYIPHTHYLCVWLLLVNYMQSYVQLTSQEVLYVEKYRRLMHLAQ